MKTVEQMLQISGCENAHDILQHYNLVPLFFESAGLELSPRLLLVFEQNCKHGVLLFYWVLLAERGIDAPNDLNYSHRQIDPYLLV